jgi:chromosome segregation ATPase
LKNLIYKQAPAQYDIKTYRIDYWARLFKSRTWEELKMIAQRDENMMKAAEDLYTMNGDETIRAQCRARADYYRMQNTINQKIKQLTADKEQLTADKEQLTADKEQLTADKEQLTADKEQLTADKEQLTADKEQLTADKEQLTADKEQLTADKKQLTADKEQLTADKKQLTAENEKLTASISEKDREIALLKKQLAERASSSGYAEEI